MPYRNVPSDKTAAMESCVAQVQADGKPKQAAIAICYSSIVGKKVLLSPYPVEEKAIGDLVPPKAAQENAARVLRWHDEHPDEIRGMTRVGWTRANQLAKGESLSWDVVGRMAQFARHRENAEVAAEYEGEPWRDAGRVAWLGWGGDEGIAWAQRMMERRRESTKARCSVKGCATSPTQFVTVKGAVLPYCEEHLPGAKDVLARHSIKVEDVRSAEQVWVDAKGLQFITNEEGRVIPIGGPGGGGGGSSPGKSFSEAVASMEITSSSKLDGGVTQASIVNYEDDGSGIVKKLSAASDAHDGNSEVAAYQINKLLGGSEVPETVYVELNGVKAGTSQMFVDNAKLGDLCTIGEIRAIDRGSLERVIALDAIIGNGDRHGGNFLVKDGKLIAIDHGHAQWGLLSAGASPLYYNKILKSVQSSEDWKQPKLLHEFGGTRSGRPYKFSDESLNTWRNITRDQFNLAMSGIGETGNVRLNNAWDNLQNIIQRGEV